MKHDENEKILQFCSTFLNQYSQSITKNDIDEISDEYINEEEAYKLLLSSIAGLNLEEKEDYLLFNNYFRKMVKHLCVDDYLNNPYLKSIQIPTTKFMNWELKQDQYIPYEAFVYDDFLQIDGRIIPQIGFFSQTFIFPAVYENNRLWMSIIPNEINTMKDDIEKITGNVVVCGLGLGYFPYMISLKNNVNKILIVEKNKDVIDLFERIILPQFQYKEKITILNIDAFDYLNNIDAEYNDVYIDLWHDVSDGLPMYKKLKEIENKYRDKRFMYWIEKSIKVYIKS